MLLSVITVNFNETEATLRLLRSGKDWVLAETEWIVVDNASVEDPTPAIHAAFPEVRVIRNETNLGFAGGNNLGIQAASGQYLFFLNNDTVVPASTPERLLHRLQSHPQIGMVSPKISYLQQADKIQFAGFTAVHPLTGRNQTLGKGQTDRGQYDRAYPIPYIHGAAFMVPAAVVAEIGPMPEEYFLYYEELDWSVRARKAGYQIWYEGQATVYHEASLSIGKQSTTAVYYYHRNRILFMQQNAPRLALGIFLLYFTALVLPKTLWQYRRAPQQRQAFLRALRWHLNRR